VKDHCLFEVVVGIVDVVLRRLVELVVGVPVFRGEYDLAFPVFRDRDELTRLPTIGFKESGWKTYVVGISSGDDLSSPCDYYSHVIRGYEKGYPWWVCRSGAVDV